MGLVLMYLPRHGHAEKLFSGHEADNQQQYYLGQRYYQPETGKFLQSDPMSLRVGQPTIRPLGSNDLNSYLNNPQNLNSYAYANNNPINQVDVDGQVSEKRQKNFDQISDYICQDEKYWLVRDRDGNGPALDLLWQKSLAINNNNISNSLETMFDAVNVNWRDRKTLDKNRDAYLDRLRNLPTALSGEFGADMSKIDGLQHFFKSAQLTLKYGARLTDVFGRAHEIMDGFRAWRTGTENYHSLKAMDEGYSARDVINNRLGISFINNLLTDKTVLPSDIINQYQQTTQTIWQGKPIQ